MRAAARAHRVGLFRVGLHVRVRGDRIRAHWAKGGKYDFPLVLRGRLIEESQGTRIRGKLTNRTSATFHGVLWFVALLMVALAVLAGRSGAPTAVVLLCSVTAFAFAAISALSSLLGAVAGSGDGRRLATELRSALGAPERP